MPEQTILIIRHAEKPEPGGDSGVDSTGAPDPRSLTVRGWQRAGAWAELFVPALGQKSALPTPTTLFASDPTAATTVARAVARKRRSLRWLRS